MKRVLRALALACIAFAGGSEPARAQSPAPPAIVVDGTPAETEAWAALQASELVKARALAEAILAQHPDSYAGQAVLGIVFHRGEADLPRSAAHLEKARAAYSQAHPGKPEVAGLYRWQLAILNELVGVYEEMERFEPMLAILEELDTNYVPKKPERRIWPLVKLRRYDEAREAGRIALQSSNASTRRFTRTGLCNLEWESGTPAAAYAACMEAITKDVGNAPDNVELSNAAESAVAMFRFEEGERLYMRATKTSQDSISTPFQRLAELYLGEGRVAEAVSAMRSAHEQQIESQPWLDQQKSGRLEGTLAELLMVAGETDRAADVAERAVTRPDRHGLWSGSPEEAHAAEAVRFATALRVRAAALDEEASASGFRDAMRARARAAMDRVEAWRQRRRAGVLLSEEAFLVRSFRPYSAGRADLVPWMVPELVDTVGGGISLAAIRRARQADGWGDAYLDAFEAEARWLSGDASAAAAVASRALGGLPTAEVLLRARVSAVAARAARDRHDNAAEADLLAQVLAHDPSLFRRLDMALPVKVESDGSELAEKTKRLLASSPRFRVESRGSFVVTLAGGQACVLGNHGERLQCARSTVPESSPVADRARGLLRELHKVAFAPKVSLTQSDLSSLDGSTATARAAKQVDDVLGGLAP